MRISKISVTGLFGMFDHEIPLNQESRITIVHGPNGVGKTVLMRMVDNLFQYEYDFYATIPFEQFTINFEEESVAVAVDSDYVLSIQHCNSNGAVLESIRFPIAHPNQIIATVKDHFPQLERIDWLGRSYWLVNDPSLRISPSGIFPSNPKGLPTEEAISLKKLFDNNSELYTNLYGKKPEWLARIRTEPITVLIDTQRLYGAFLYDSNPVPSSAIRSLRFRFNSFFLEHLAGFFYDQEKSRRLNELADMVSEVDENEISSQLHSAADKLVSDHENQKHYREMMLFVEIINERFLFKEFYIGMDDFGEDEYGIGKPIASFYSEGSGTGLPMSQLSSGEQHLLLLYYQLLFEIEPDTLVMIDEPELSMNVVWQRNFLKDLQRIVELRQFDVLIATHSPQIIHDKWDWMVPLGENIDIDAAD